MKNFYLFFFVVHALYEAGSCILLPKYIKRCHFGDSKCIIKSSNDIIRNYPKGIPEIGLPPLDETNIEDVLAVDVHVGNEMSKIKLTDNVMKGFNNATITFMEGFDKDPTKQTIEVRAHIPRLLHEATYIMTGDWYGFKTNSTDKLESDFQNVSLSIKFKAFVEFRNNRRFLRIYELVPKVQLNRWIFMLHDLYKENSDLTIAMNRLFNENWVELWNEREPDIMKSFIASGKAILNFMFDNICYDDMFLPDPLYNATN